MDNKRRRPVDMEESDLQAGQWALFGGRIVKASEGTAISLAPDLRVVTSKDHQSIQTCPFVSTQNRTQKGAVSQRQERFRKTHSRRVSRSENYRAYFSSVHRTSRLVLV